MSEVPEGRAEPIKPHMPRAAEGSVGRTRFTGAAVIQRRTQGRTWGAQRQRCQRVPKARAGCDLSDHGFPHKTDHDRRLLPLICSSNKASEAPKLMSRLRFHSPCFYPPSRSSATPEFGGLDRVPERPRPPPGAALDPRLRHDRRHRPARSHRSVPAQQPPAEGPGERPGVPGRPHRPRAGPGSGFTSCPFRGQSGHGGEVSATAAHLLSGERGEGGFAPAWGSGSGQGLGPGATPGSGGRGAGQADAAGEM